MAVTEPVLIIFLWQSLFHCFVCRSIDQIISAASFYCLVVVISHRFFFYCPFMRCYTTAGKPSPGLPPPTFAGILKPGVGGGNSHIKVIGLIMDNEGSDEGNANRKIRKRKSLTKGNANRIASLSCRNIHAEI